jgi:hypothetical protein
VSLIELCNISLGSLGCARSAQQNIRGSIASTRTVHMNSVESKKNILGVHTKVITNSRGAP